LQYAWLSLTGFIAAIPGFIAGLLSAAGAAIAAAASVAGPVLLAIAIIGALYLAWKNNWFGIGDIVNNVVGWIGDQLNRLFGYLGDLMVRIGILPADWRSKLEDMKRSVSSFASGIADVVKGKTPGGLLGMLGLNKAIDISSLVSQGQLNMSNLPPGTAGLIPGANAGTNTGLGDIALSTGTKMSELASAAQNAINSIGTMAQSASDASIALGKMPGVNQGAPGDNGWAENIFRLQDVAQNYLNHPGKDTQKWVEQFGLQGMGKPEAVKYAQEVVGKFQMHLYMDPEVLKVLGPEGIGKLKSQITQTAEGETQTRQFATMIGADPKMLQTILGGQGLALSDTQAQMLATAAKMGTLGDIVKGSMDNVLPTINGNTAALVTATTASNDVATALRDLRGRLDTVFPANLPGTTSGGTTGVWPPKAQPFPTPWGNTVAPVTAPKMTEAIAGNIPGMSGIEATVRKFMGTYQAPGTAYWSVPVRPIAPVTPETPYNMTQPMRPTATMGGNTLSIKVDVASGAVQVDGTGANTSFGDKLGKAVVTAIRALTLAERGFAFTAPMGLPGNPGR
jgi:hypothetical protein